MHREAPHDVNLINMNRLLKIFAATLLVTLFCAGVTAKPIKHYVFFGMDREKLKEASSFLESKSFAGAQVAYSWNQLEQGKDGYDFSIIREDLALLTAKNKRLWIQIQDVSFSEKRIFVPRYILRDPQYNGGADKQYRLKVVDNTETDVTVLGWVARRWDPAVQDRFHKLLFALGKEFDGKIEGVNSEETSIYLHVNPKTGKRVTIAEAMDFAENYLKVDYIFWCTEEPYYSEDLLPFLQRLKK